LQNSRDGLSFRIKKRKPEFEQHIIHTLVKTTVFANACHFRTQVSAIATHFLQTVFSTVHYMILLCQIPAVFLLLKNAETQGRRS